MLQRLLEQETRCAFVDKVSLFKSEGKHSFKNQKWQKMLQRLLG